MTNYCTPVGDERICPDVTDDKIIFGLVIMIFGGVNYYVLSSIVSLILGGDMTTLEKRWVNVKKPQFVGGYVLLILLLAAFAELLPAVSLVDHNIHCCRAVKNKDETAWTVVDGFFILQLFTHYAYAVAITKSETRWLHFLSAACVVAAHVGVIVAMIFSYHALAFWTYAAFSVVVAVVLAVTLWIANNNRKTWKSIRSWALVAMVQDATSFVNVKKALLEALGFKVQFTDAEKKEIAIIDVNGNDEYGGAEQPLLGPGDLPLTSTGRNNKKPPTTSLTF